MEERVHQSEFSEEQTVEIISVFRCNRSEEKEEYKSQWNPRHKRSIASKSDAKKCQSSPREQTEKTERGAFLSEEDCQSTSTRGGSVPLRALDEKRLAR